jgi:hypothetical protein
VPLENPEREESHAEPQSVETERFRVLSSGSFEWIGEVVVQPQADPAEVMRVYQTLKDTLPAEIFSIDTSQQGTTIVCGVQDPVSFLNLLSRMPRIAAWDITHQ